MMRRLPGFAAPKMRGGWILLEVLRELGCVTLVVAGVIAGLQQAMPQPQIDAMTAATVGPPIYGLGVAHHGEQLWMHRMHDNWTLCDLHTLAEVDSVRYADGLQVDADAAGPASTLTRVIVHGDDLQLIRGDVVRTISEWSKSDGQISDVAVQPDGLSAAAVTTAGLIVCATWEHGAVEIRKAWIEGPINLVRLTADGRWIVMVVDNETLVVYDRIRNREVRRWQAHHMMTMGVTLSPDSRWIATGGKDGLVRVWELATGQVRWQAKSDVHSPISVQFSADGSQLAAGGFDTVIRLWDAATGDSLGELTGHRGPVRTLAFHPDGQRLYSGSLKGELFEWSLASRTVLRELH